MRTSTLRSFVALALAATGCGVENKDGEKTAPAAVILVSLDTFRADRLALYGYPRETAPNLTALGRESLTFTAAAAQATQTLISHKSMLTAKYPLRLIQETTGADRATLDGLTDPTRFLINTFQGLRAEPLVTEMRKHGYRTAAFVDGGWMERRMGFARGFDDFDDEGGRLERILPKVSQWLSQHGSERFFFFVHAYDLHCPYSYREPFDRRFCENHDAHIPLEAKCGKPELMGASLAPEDLRGISDHYDGGIASADAYLGELIETLKKSGLFEESLFIVTSDHGDSFGEHGQIGHGGLQLEQLLVPLIVKPPASWAIEPGRVERPVALVDVLPSVCDALGIEIPEGLDGRSIWELVDDEDWDRRFLIAQTSFLAGAEETSMPTTHSILVPGRWLVVQNGDAESPRIFDLERDPQAATALGGRAEDWPVAARMLAMLNGVEGDDPASEFAPPEDTPIDEDLRRELKSLGYLK